MTQNLMTAMPGYRPTKISHKQTSLASACQIFQLKVHSCQHHLLTTFGPLARSLARYVVSAFLSFDLYYPSKLAACSPPYSFKKYRPSKHTLFISSFSSSSSSSCSFKSIDAPSIQFARKKYPKCLPGQAI